MPRSWAFFSADNILYKFPLAIALSSYILNCSYPCDPNGSLEWDSVTGSEVHPKTGSSLECWNQCRVYYLRLALLRNSTPMSPTIDMFHGRIDRTSPNPFCFPPEVALDRTDHLFKYRQYEAKRLRSRRVYSVMITAILLSFVSLMFQVTMMMASDSNMAFAFYSLLVFTSLTNVLSFFYGTFAQSFILCDYGVSLYDEHGKFIEFRQEYFCNAHIMVTDEHGKERTVQLPAYNPIFYRLSLFLKIINLFFNLMGGVYYYSKIRFTEMRGNRIPLPAELIN